MRIVIAGSMQHSERMLEIQEELRKRGHEVFVSKYAPSMVGKPDEEKEKMKLHQKYNLDAIKQFWEMMQGADALLVVNFDKNGIKNYIGGNTLMDIALAHVLNQKLFLLHPIPDIPYYKTEIEALRPVILNGDLDKIK